MLSTGFLRQDQGTDFVLCSLANLGNTATSVKIAFLNTDGTSIDPPVTLPVDPGQGTFLLYDGGGLVRCELSFVGFAKDVRGTMMITGGPTTAVLEAR